MGDHPALPSFPIGLFPVEQRCIRTLLEAADEATLAGQIAWANGLIARARQEAAALRNTIGGIA